jgi:hypothetical protein
MTSQNVIRSDTTIIPNIDSTHSELLPLYDDRLYNTKKIAKLVKYCLISTFTKTTLAPLSLFLIAPTESNKTKILLLLKKFPYTETIENLSAKPLNKLIAKQEKQQEIFHIIILDFIRLLQQKSKTCDAVISTLLNLTEEGSQESLFYGQEYKLKRRIKIGIITGITPQLFKKHFAKWNENGAMTRWFFCSYLYSNDTKNTIKTFISKNLPYMVDDVIVKVKKHGRKEIPINQDIARALTPGTTCYGVAIGDVDNDGYNSLAYGDQGRSKVEVELLGDLGSVLGGFYDFDGSCGPDDIPLFLRCFRDVPPPFQLGICALATSAVVRLFRSSSNSMGKLMLPTWLYS